VVASDAYGGVYFAWEDGRPFPAGYVPDIYATRLTNIGTIAFGWRPNGAPVCSTAVQSFSPVIKSDGQGGAFISYYDGSGGLGGGIFVQRMAPNGAPLWQTNGVLASGVAGSPGGGPSIAPDDSQGLFVAWGDDRANPGFARAIYAQHVSSDGTLIWDPNGIEISTSTGFNDDPSIVSDGGGGAYVSWVDNRVAGVGRCYVQHLDGEGDSLWPNSGSPATTSMRNQVMAPGRSLQPDGSGGVYVGWSDNYTGSTGVAFAQRLTSAGFPSPGWPDTGVRARITAFPGGIQGPPYLLRSDTSGVFLTWIQGAAIEAQRLGLDGARQWGDPAVAPFGGRLCSYHDTVSDSAGGLIIATAYGTYVIAQRLDSNGVKLWGSLGLHLSSGASNKKFVAGAPDGAHGAIFAWSDDRNDAGDIYAQNVSADGVLGNDIVAVDLALQSATATPSEVDLHWFAGDPEISVITLERTSDGSAWNSIASLTRKSGSFDYEDRDVDPGRRYGYRVRYQSGREDVVSAVAWVDVPTRLEWNVAGPWPQPSNHHVDLRLTLPSRTRVRVAIHDLQGREVSVLTDGFLEPGQHLLRWNLELTRREIADGVYFARINAAGRIVTRKIIVAR